MKTLKNNDWDAEDIYKSHWMPLHNRYEILFNPVRYKCVKYLTLISYETL